MKLILGTTCHLPNGCEDDEAELLYNREIKPLISAVYQFPKIQITVHYSGVLLNWIERKHPELIMLLNELLSRKQAELLGGGFYEPILPVLPQADKIGQLEMLTTYIRKQFGRRPQGCWIPALAWEQNLVGALSTCGMAYTFLEDFRFAQYQNDRPFYAPCITEDQGKLITVFPLSLDFAKEFYCPGIFAKLERFQGEIGNPVTIFPRWVREGNSELEAIGFFERLAKTEIDFTLPGRVYKSLKDTPKLKPKAPLYTPKRLYFNGNSSGRAALTSQPRQFLTAYPEANGIYTKMIYTSNFANHLRGDIARKRNAREEIWKAQDCGIFRDEEDKEGLSRPHLRKAAYRALLEAEKTSREKEKFTPSLSVMDFDLDGEDEYLLSDDKVNAYINAEGAGLFELDFLPASWNYLDIFIAPENVFSGGGAFAGRRCFTDYLAPVDAYPPDLSSAVFLGNKIFKVKEEDRVKRKIVFKLGTLEENETAVKDFEKIEMIKTWQMKKSVTALRYALKNTGTGAKSFSLVSRIVFSFSGAAENSLRIMALRDGSKRSIKHGSITEGSSGLEFQDVKNESVLFLEANRSFTADIKPVLSGGVYQFTEIFLWLPVSLESGKQWDADLSLKISS